MSKSGQIIIPFGDAPTTPSSGKVTIYAKSDKNLYFKDDTGAEYPVTVSGGLITDHGLLTGLEDNDHVQYLLEEDFATYSGTIDEHMEDSSIHFTESSIDKYTRSEVDELITTLSGAIQDEIGPTSDYVKYDVYVSSAYTGDSYGSITHPFKSGVDAMIFAVTTYTGINDYVSVTFLPGEYYINQTWSGTSPTIKVVKGVSSKSVIIRPTSNMIGGCLIATSSTTSLSNVTIDCSDIPEMLTTSGSMAVGIFDDSYEEVDIDNVSIIGVHTGIYTDVESNIYCKEVNIYNTRVGLDISGGALFDADTVYIRECSEKHIYVHGGAEAYIEGCELYSDLTLSGTGVHVEGDTSHVELFGGTNLWALNKNAYIGAGAELKIDNSVLENTESTPGIEQKATGKLTIVNSRVPLGINDINIETPSDVYINAFDSNNNTTLIGNFGDQNQTLMGLATGYDGIPSLRYESNHHDGFKVLMFDNPIEGQKTELGVNAANADSSIGVHVIGDTAHSKSIRICMISDQGDDNKVGWDFIKHPGEEPIMSLTTRSGGNTAFSASCDGEFQLKSGEFVNKVLNENDLHSNDNKALATQQSIKTYVDNRTYSSSALDSGQLDNRYYTETEINTLSGVLDSRMLYADGSKELSNNWDAGEYRITASGFSVGNMELDLSRYSSYTGVISGGNISVNIEDPTLLDISAGTSIYFNASDPQSPILETLSWDDQSIYPGISGSTTHWLGVYRSAPGVGSFVHQLGFTTEETRSIAVLGRFWTISGTNIAVASNYTSTGYGIADSVRDLIYTFGTINISGNTYTASLSSPMRLKRSEGEAFRYGANFVNNVNNPNIYTSSTEAPVAVYRYTEYNAPSQLVLSEIEPNYYDLDGVRTPVPSEKWSVQRIFYYPVSNYTIIHYGQAIYEDKHSAIDSIATEDPKTNIGILAGAVLRSYLIIKQGATDLTDNAQAELKKAYGTVGLISGVTNHSNLGGLQNDDHSQYHTDSRGDIRYYTRTEVDTWREDNSHTASGIVYNNTAWNSNNVKESLDSLTEYAESTLGSGRITPDICMVRSADNLVTVYSGSGFISYSGYHRAINWSEVEINTAGQSEGSYYVYIDQSGIVNQSVSNPGYISVINLGFYFYSGEMIEVVSNNGLIISNSINKTAGFFRHLGSFIYDNGGLVQELPGGERKIVSTACMAQSELSEVALPEVSSNDALTTYFSHFKSSDIGWSTDFYNLIEESGSITLSRWNNTTLSGAVLSSASCVFTNGSNNITSSSNLTSEISAGNYIYRDSDTLENLSLVSGVSWNGSATTIALYNTYKGSNYTGIAHISRSMDMIPEGKYVKHLLIRTLDGYMHFVYGPVLFNDLTEAIDSARPSYPAALEEISLNMAYIIVTPSSGILDIRDIRPLPFSGKDGGSQTGGVSGDHGDLIGLSDDDHIQYMLTTGARNFTSAVSYNSHPTFTLDTQITDKKYVDDTVNNKVHHHGGLSGLEDDDHTQYSKADGTRSFSGKVAYTSTPTINTDVDIPSKKYVDDTVNNKVHHHGGLSGLSDDDHTQYSLVDGSRSFSSKVSYASHPTFITDTEVVDKKYVDDKVSGLTTDHGALTGLGDDDHPQYHNDTRGDTRYYTKTQVDAGQLDNRYYTETEIDTIISGSIYSDLPVCQVRRTTNFTIPTSWANVTFDATDIQNVTDILEHDVTNTDLIYIKVSGLYFINYKAQVLASTATTYSYGRVLKNNTTLILGSEKEINTYQGEVQILNGCCYTQLLAGDYISLQLYTPGSVVSTSKMDFTISATKGVKGDPGTDGLDGAPGSGSTLIVKDEGLNVTGTPHSAFNFVGNGVTVTDGGSGVATITISNVGALIIKDEGTNIANTPHTSLNFIGSDISATDGGSGVANITTSSPIFGSNFNNIASEASSNTNSTTFINKVTLNLTSIPSGSYRVGWYLEWNRNVTSSDFIAQVQIDDTTTIMQTNVELSDVLTWHTESGFYVASLTSGDHFIDLDYRSEVATGVSYIRRARLEFWRVS